MYWYFSISLYLCAIITARQFVISATQANCNLHCKILHNVTPIKCKVTKLAHV